MNMLLSPELFILSARGGPSEREDVRADLGDNRPFSGLSLKSAWGIFKAGVFGNYLICFVCTLGLVLMAHCWGK